MIKALAALFMLIDHIGLIFFPQLYVLRIIGRLSMPLFAFSIARGFYFSEEKGTTVRYAFNLFLFAVASQIPFTVLSVWVQDEFSLNIGFTWLLAVCLMKAYASEKKILPLCGMCALIFLIALVLPVDFGLYGVLYPFAFFLFLYCMDKPEYAFAAVAALYALYVIVGGGQGQAFSLLAFPVLLIARKYDDKTKLPRKFFYWFYPLHIAVLLLVLAAIIYV